jgi:hypothetical protein
VQGYISIIVLHTPVPSSPQQQAHLMVVAGRAYTISEKQVVLQGGHVQTSMLLLFPAGWFV